MPAEALSMPAPPDHLIARVGGAIDRTTFFWTGRDSVLELERTLATLNRSLASFESVLDFGCGCGRMLLWMEEVGRLGALHATDVDREAVGWCRQHIPYAQLSVNGPNPPLPYSDGEFDLVFNHSVFTHLDEVRQDMWLDELHRVVRPGGLLVLSTQGEPALPDGAWKLRDSLERDGIATLDNSDRDPGLPDWYQNTWHAPWYIFEHWGRWFRIRAYIPGGGLGFQDHVLMERREEGELRRPVTARSGRRAQGAVATSRVQEALTSSRAHRRGSHAVNSRFGKIGRIARRAVLRMMRPYTAHEDNFDDAVATSVTELGRAVEQHADALRHLQRDD
jgi:SAM-dependent methyltransferase